MVHSLPGFFVSFEGTEGAGKSTLIRYLGQLLDSQGYLFISTREPGGQPLAESIRSLLLQFQMHPKTEVLLYEAARAEHLETVILPALRGGQVVLCDRFTDSTLAYQAHARGLPWEEIKALNRFACSDIQPHLTVLLAVTPETGLKRATHPNRFEAEGLAFQQKVWEGYEKAKAEDPNRWVTLTVDSQTPQQLAQIVFQSIQKGFQK